MLASMPLDCPFLTSCSIYDERALAAITHSSILPELLPVLTSTRASLVVATGELLATITDEYAPAIEQVWKASGAFGILLGLAKVPLTVESCQASILATGKPSYRCQRVPFEK